MDVSKIPIGSVVKINLHLLLACLLAGLAGWAWPNTSRNWGFAVAALVSALASVCAVKTAWVEMVLLRNRVRDVGGFWHRILNQSKISWRVMMFCAKRV